MTENLNNNVENTNMNTTTQYVDEFGNPIDPSLIDENGNYIGETVTQYVDEFGNPIDPSLIDENGNYIGNAVQNETITSEGVQESLSNAATPTTIISAAEHQMDNKELLTSMVTFDYNNIPITDIVNSIILDAINKGASDIHFDPFDQGIKIRIRIDGQLNDYSVVPLFVKKNMITRIKIISGMNITESRIPQDGAIRTELQNKTIDLRVSCLPTNLGEKIVVRIMDYSMSSNGIEALDFNEENLEKVKKMLALPNGIILVTGATGSGKSTTVYSMLQRLNVEGTNLITVEDPIEMNIGGINQVQTQAEIGLDFATVLRSILRQDPDVIMIGEIRDDETARIAVRASITGHLVLSTIHTNNSLNTIERLTDMSVERYLLGSSLSGVVSQKLARRLCDKCKKLRPTTEYEKDIFKKALNKDVEEIYEPVGCPECAKGYRGRIAIHEVLYVNQLVRDAITKGVEKRVLRNIVYQDCQTMLQDGLEKVLESKTSFDEIIKLIDLDDDLGTGTELGLENQLFESNVASNNGVTNITPANGQININITPDMLAGLQNLSNIVPQTPAKEVVEENTNLDEPAIKEEPVIVDEPAIKELDNEPVVEEVEELVVEENTNEEISDDDLIVEELDSPVIEEITDEDKNEEVEELIQEESKEEIIEDIKENKIEISYEELLKNKLDQLFNLKYMITKSKFNLKAKEILNTIEDIKNDYIFTDEDKKQAVELIEKISLQQHKENDKDLIDKYEETVKLISVVFNLDFMLDNGKIDDNELDTILDDMNSIMIDSMDFDLTDFDINLEDE